MKLRKITKKKAQMEVPIISFFIVVVGLIFFAPYILKIINTFGTQFGGAVGNMSTQAETNFNYVTDTFVNFWDFVIIFAFFMNVIILLITSFLVDTHPAWLITYILFFMFLMMLGMEVTVVLDKIYDSAQFALEVSQLEMIDFIRQYLGIIIVGIYFITGVIIFSKFKFGGQR